MMKAHPHSTASVSIHVRDLSQMLSSLDPSPFWDRDLDQNAAAFIEDEFSDKRSATAWHLHVHTHGDAALASDLQTAVENYYGRMAAAARRELFEHRRMGHIALIVGIIAFAICMTARELLLRFVAGLPQALDEGLIILGWIALWRPTEMLAYEWVPLVRKRRLYDRLAAVRVAVRSDPPAALAVSATPG
ncbi:MAG: hypothetical protein ABI885_00205 [Gammaproteobacteria bacterium]